MTAAADVLRPDQRAVAVKLRELAQQCLVISVALQEGRASIAGAGVCWEDGRGHDAFGLALQAAGFDFPRYIVDDARALAIFAWPNAESNMRPAFDLVGAKHGYTVQELADALAALESANDSGLPTERALRAAPALAVVGQKLLQLADAIHPRGG